MAETRRRLRTSWRQRGASEAELTWIDDVLDENVLTIGFARRVPSYKRLTLMLNDPEQLARLLNDPARPVQIIVAGKAHPADDGGKALIQQMVQFSDIPDVRRRIVFLPGYDMAMADSLVQGCDVWLNNPLRPLEACGTSGMKAALNGGLNLSVRDGWWDEWYDGGNGWDIPSADGVADTSRRDELEAQALYELLGKSVAPLFYDQDADGVPLGWVERIRHTLRSLGPKVQAERMVRQYVTELYAPAARASAQLTDDDGFGPARELAAWKQRVVAAWPAVRIEHVESEAARQLLGRALTVRVTVALGELSTDDVTVEVVYGRTDEDDEIVQPSYATLALDSLGGTTPPRPPPLLLFLFFLGGPIPPDPPWERPIPPDLPWERPIPPDLPWERPIPPDLPWERPISPDPPWKGLLAPPYPPRCGIPVSCRWTGPGRSATRSGCCRGTRCLTAAPSLAWSLTRRRRPA